MIKNIFKSNCFSFLIILIFNILLITGKIEFGSESGLVTVIAFMFCFTSGLIIEIKRGNKSTIKLRILTTIIFSIILLSPINIIPNKYSYSSLFIIATELLMLEIIIYYFISDKI
ncbi:hypothetical protein DP145_13000 [Clostridium tetani]|uniref:Uncharacterized protein n=1 Tax=Clostridium tetani TaxID=1513 RepID=A0A4V1LEC3_CLOTA|nr:hypothetical protein [Clostridium tetani]RXI44000.1 hypothetical protein DP126_12365 [Clostridium tetani]RXI44292.1 hypothetical protein DP130_13535 [Clostridium tetani]RXM59553.1 hypothetical protein DP138_12640 [Clostridium tetani]RXM63716.1 hypothetical protein DP145_13000 [Clostridium tetani]BDR68556.1 hypothetical protein K144312032_p10460 [Clostridium tetani]